MYVVSSGFFFFLYREKARELQVSTWIQTLTGETTIVLKRYFSGLPSGTFYPLLSQKTLEITSRGFTFEHREGYAFFWNTTWDQSTRYFCWSWHGHTYRHEALGRSPLLCFYFLYHTPFHTKIATLCVFFFLCVTSINYTLSLLSSSYKEPFKIFNRCTILLHLHFHWLRSQK